MPSTVLCVLIALLLAAGSAAAQDGLAASENFVVVAQEVVAAGGVSSSESFTATQGVGGAAIGHRATSESYAVESGVAATTGGLTVGGKPIIAGVSPPADVGENPAIITGFNLAAANPLVFFGVQQATVTGGVTNTMIPVTTPDGLDGMGSSVGQVDVRVFSNVDGTFFIDVLPGGFTFLPALSFAGPGVDDGEAHLRVNADVTGFTATLVLGTDAALEPVSLGAAGGPLRVGGDLVVLPPVRTETDEARFVVELPEGLPPGSTLHVQGVLQPTDVRERVRITNPLVVEW